jgi:hypothetical protein
LFIFSKQKINLVDKKGKVPAPLERNICVKFSIFELSIQH